MNNYNKPESFKKKVLNTFKPVDKKEEIKKEINKQKEEIQKLENSIKYYFIDKSKFVNFRAEPDINGIVITILKHGTFIDPIVYTEAQEWTKAKYNNVVGYVMTKYIGVENSTLEE